MWLLFYNCRNRVLNDFVGKNKFYHKIGDVIIIEKIISFH